MSYEVTSLGDGPDGREVFSLKKDGVFDSTSTVINLEQTNTQIQSELDRLTERYNTRKAVNEDKKNENNLRLDAIQAFIEAREA
jgi:hypothetical protein